VDTHVGVNVCTLVVNKYVIIYLISGNNGNPNNELFGNNRNGTLFIVIGTKSRNEKYVIIIRDSTRIRNHRTTTSKREIFVWGKQKIFTSSHQQSKRKNQKRDIRKQSEKYNLLSGETRWKCKMNKFKEIPIERDSLQKDGGWLQVPLLCIRLPHFVTQKSFVVVDTSVELLEGISGKIKFPEIRIEWFLDFVLLTNTRVLYQI